MDLLPRWTQSPKRPRFPGARDQNQNPGYVHSQCSSDHLVTNNILTQPRPTTSSNATQVPNAALYPWSQRRLNFPTPQSNPFPRYGAAVNAIASKDGDIYIMGGLINGSMVRGDLWMVESGPGNLSCYPIATVSEGPGPRVGHASLLVGNAFIVFGGDTKMDDNDVLDDTLYLLNTCKCALVRACVWCAHILSFPSMVQSVASGSKTIRALWAYPEYLGL